MATLTVQSAAAGSSFVPRKGPSPDTIKETRAKILNFLVSEKGQELTGPLATFKGVLTLITHQFPNPKFAFETTGALFTEILSQALDAKFIDEGVGDVYFHDDVDQVLFVAELVNDVLNYGAPTPITDEQKLEVQNELIQFIKSRSFVRLGDTLKNFADELEEVEQQAGGNDELAYFDRKSSSSKCNLHLFTKIITEGEENKFLSDRVSQVFFAQSFDRRSFTKALREEVYTEASRQGRRERRVRQMAETIQQMDPKLALQLGKAGTKKLAETFTI